ncbi:protein EMBRYO DEFECTIVE 514 [Malania oleifera]|uniref:protein EMBRYO DEFECTIVE 514 n=1 Tax=Malania oleifera TaxID=397392 RepID=UPI0025AE4A06|nr:protein EMBRYO DEFECTIVE 514 [Malania oleifera]
MAAESATVSEVHEPTAEPQNPITADMDLETLDSAPIHPDGDGEAQANGGGKPKRVPEGDAVSDDEDGRVSKKLKVEKSVEEERLENKEGSEDVEGTEGEEKKTDVVSLGPKSFGSAVEMFDYFYKLLHYWPANLDLNKYERMVLLELLKKGHLEPDKKIRGGIKAFQVRNHPMWRSRCFFLIREDDSVDDFSFRKCVDHILPLPEEMKAKSDVSKSLGGKGRGGSGWGRARGGRRRN